MENLPVWAWMLLGGAVFWIGSSAMSSARKGARKATRATANVVPIVLSVVGFFAIVAYLMGGL